jgi:hypothetical protein
MKACKMDKIYPLKPCPWCGKTPKLKMYYDEITWLPRIICFNRDCVMEVQTKYVPIRKSQKSNPEIIKRKLEKVISNWNENNPMVAFEGISLNFDEIAKEGM